MSARKTDALKSQLIAIAMMFVVSPSLFFIAFSRSERVSEKAKFDSVAQGISSAATFFLGIAVMVNAYYTAKRAEAEIKNAIATERSNEINQRNTEVMRSRLIADRFMTAVSQLGNEYTATRAGAIYSLEQVAHESLKEHWTVMEILSAFLREQCKQIDERDPQTSELPPLPVDIQAALTVIGRRDINLDPTNKLLDLRNVKIPHADLRGANCNNLDLRGADLRGADLRGAELDDSQLVGASLYKSNLHKANLRSANLSNANLNRAWICGANLQSANLQGASLRSANLQGANLYKANLQSANLRLANLQSAKLFLANLQGAKLGKANLQATGLIGANLQSANLNGANLQQVNLNAAKLQYAEAYFANFSNATLKEADLSAANLMGSNFKKADFETANLFQTNFMGANLLDVNLTTAIWEGAILTGVKNFKSQSTQVMFGEL